MKKNGKYRFSLQFPAESEEQIQVGELLERLGNRKSVIVVEALKDYLAAHPDLLDQERRVEITTIHSLSPQALEELVRKILGETRGMDNVIPSNATNHDLMDTNISEMLDNMDIFR